MSRVQKKSNATKYTPPQTIKSRVWDITPAIARELLDRNEKNRNVSEKTVELYARQMAKGDWQLNGEAIRLTVEGKLADGQHRLLAVIKSGCDVPMLVVEGVERDAIKTIDTGKTRSAGDHLKIYGIATKDPNVAASAARIVSSFDKNGLYLENKVKFTPTEIIDFLQSNKGIMHAMDRIPNSIGPFLPRSLAVALYFMFNKINPTRNDEFWAQLMSGENLTRKSPILALRNRLVQIRSSKFNGNNRRQYVSLVIRAFEAVAEHKELGELKYHLNSDIVLKGLK